MYSTSTGLACSTRRFASCAAFHASAPASGPIGALMLGPYAKAIPHQQMAHFGIQARRLAEGVDRAVVVEAEAEREPLIEVALGVLALGGDRVVDLAEPVEELRHMALRLARGMARLAGAEGEPGGQAEHEGSRETRHRSTSRFEATSDGVAV